MKKYLFTLFAVLGLATTAVAQDSFRRDTDAFNLGIGIGNAKNVSFPALSLTYERSIADNIFSYGSIGLGAQAEYQGFSYMGLTGRELFVGARASFHYEFVDRLDTYVGLQAGVHHLNPLAGANSTSFRTMGVLGARYFFNDTLGIFAELGTNITFFKVGLAFNL